MAQYPIILLLLFIALKGYLKLATKYNIIDKPNERSSHIQPTIRGGGIVFFLAILLFFVLNGFEYPYFFVGILLVSVISFVDDLYTIGSPIRLAIQLLAVLLVLFEISDFQLSILLMALSIFFSIGFLNIYNFMDGINGITGLYSITVILALFYCNYFVFEFIQSDLLIYSMLALLVFGFFNFRKKAICFAGDIGSISLGLLIVFCIGNLIYTSNNIFYVFLILLYVLDGGITIVERLVKRENIFAPHRKHLYQALVDNTTLSHLQVSYIYVLWQAIISLLFLYLTKANFTWYFYLVLLFLNIAMYISCKTYVIKKQKMERL